MKSKQKKSIIEIIYESIMFVLAFLAVATIWYATQYDSIIVWGTWAIFFIDFVIRFFTAEKKWEFIKSNPFMIIAIVPLDAIFQLARIARLLHFMRLKVITKYYTKPLIQKLEKQKFSYVIPVAILIVFICIIPLYVFEARLETYYEAFIGGMLSLVFFGYTAINPQTTIGTVIITLLTIVGVIMHGVIISILFNYIKNLDVVKNLVMNPKNEKKNKGL